ncbi:hypothetical protein GVN21_12025 [Caulobacter sp. SLTY]|uniref:hypothetical protein n=1 Tax=Caulobacter sp. SLTY TaxID=2683262 RepID=UPI0014122314|nr:hypothetical protein [Caulobacter sp. SLTY]NBB16086.1 hypothetical protein [Caulobacter sp. SLTY]
MTVSRRVMFYAPLAVVPLLAQPAAAATRETDVSKVFVFLDNFLRMTPAERARLKVSFYLTQNGKPPKGVKAWIIDKDGTRTDVPIAADGRFEREPTLRQLVEKSKMVFEGPDRNGYSVRIGLVWGSKPAIEMDARKVADYLEDANAIVKKAAGKFGMVAPKMVQVAFPGGGTGTAVLANGSTAPLPLFKGMPAYNPGALPAAAKLRFAKLPWRMEFAGPKHSGVVFG